MFALANLVPAFKHFSKNAELPANDTDSSKGIKRLMFDFSAALSAMRLDGMPLHGQY